MIIAVIVIFIIQDHSGMGMPVEYAQIAFLVIMGNHVMSHNQRPAEMIREAFMWIPVLKSWNFLQR